MSRVILHMDTDTFFASLEQRYRPELKGKPVIVGSPPSRQAITEATRARDW